MRLKACDGEVRVVSAPLPVGAYISFSADEDGHPVMGGSLTVEMNWLDLAKLRASPLIQELIIDE